MKLLYRIGFYLVGFSVGLILLAVILKGKKTSCNYGPNDRVISNLSRKSWSSEVVNHASFDAISFHKFLEKASVDFSKSDTQKDSCRVYFLNGYWNDQAISLEVENCEKEVKLIRLNLKND
ncbi:MAG: hypothetical protein CND43_03770 [Flavobacteriales bacterium MED-G15]|nr:MAG: hypothetical protein CND43_03770 [Flavobacteriales bacterium MED-G15]|tara:strand:+ start:2246 stop:2608 length:363 start_codon:yes stop_codon:yes gene_type:complete